MTHHIKFKDKTSNQWFKSKDFESKDEMMAHYWTKVRSVASDVKFNAPKADKKKTQKEDTNMDSQSILENIITGDAVAAEAAFTSAMAKHVTEAVDELRPQTYAGLFGADKPIVVEGDKDTRYRRRAKMELDAKAKEKAKAVKEETGEEEVSEEGAE